MADRLDGEAVPYLQDEDSAVLCADNDVLLSRHATHYLAAVNECVFKLP